MPAGEAPFWGTSPWVVLLVWHMILGAVAVAALYKSTRGMFIVHLRRQAVHWCCYLFTLRRRRVPLHEFYSGITEAYGEARFTRVLTLAEVQQLAVHAGFPSAAAAALAAQLQRAAGTAAPSAAAMRLPTIGIPAWRFRFFMWWFKSHMRTLQTVRKEWELDNWVVGGFEITRVNAIGMLFRRPKGTCLVRVGTEAGGLIVSLRPDRGHLPDEPRTVESFFSSVSPAHLAGAAYELAQNAQLPDRHKRREGNVVHVFLPDASLRAYSGVWACLTHMRHTKNTLITATGEVVPTSAAFSKLHPAKPSFLALAERQDKPEMDALFPSLDDSSDPFPGPPTPLEWQQEAPAPRSRPAPVPVGDDEMEGLWRVLQARAELAALSGADPPQLLGPLPAGL